jgi:hypothetical protein
MKPPLPGKAAKENRRSIRNHPDNVQLFRFFLGQPDLEKN